MDAFDFDAELLGTFFSIDFYIDITIETDGFVIL